MSPRIVAFSDVESAYDDPDRVARLAGTVRSLDDDRTLVVDAGDSTALGALAFATERGRGQARPFVDRVAPDVHVPGNHDFDPGRDWLAAFTRETDGAWLAANARTGTGAASPTDADWVPEPFVASTTVSLDGERVAVIGVAHPETDRLTDTGDVTFVDPVPVAQSVAADATAEYVVIASHGGRHDRRLARETDADLVLGGHSHDACLETVAGTPLARTAAGGHRVVVADLAGDVRFREADGPEDGQIRATYRERHEHAGLSGRIDTTDAMDELRVARRVARAYRRQADADCAVVLEASVRRGLSGPVTRADALGVVPFGSTLQTVTVRGLDCRDALAQAADGPLDDTHGRAIWAGSDPERGTIRGDTPSESATYEVAMMSYTTDSGLLPGVTADRVTADHGPQHEAWLADLRAHGVRE